MKWEDEYRRDLALACRRLPKMPAWLFGILRQIRQMEPGRMWPCLRRIQDLMRQAEDMPDDMNWRVDCIVRLLAVADILGEMILEYGKYPECWRWHLVAQARWQLVKALRAWLEFGEKKRMLKAIEEVESLAADLEKPALFLLR